jgi:hypothetical protein
MSAVRRLLDRPFVAPFPPHLALERIAAPQVTPRALEMPPRPLPAPVWAEAVREHRILGVASVTLAFAATVLGWPILGWWLLATGAAACFGLIVRDVVSPEFARRVHGPLGPPLRPQVAPEDVEPEALRAEYLGLLSAYEDLRVALTESEAVLGVLRDLYERCGELVQAAGRFARNGNALSQYLAGQSPTLAETPQRLERRGSASADRDAARAYRHAASISRQHLELNRQIQGLYERIEGRLAAAMAFLGVVRALVVKLQALDLEHIQAAGPSITDSVNELRGELDLLEKSLETALAEASAD